MSFKFGAHIPFVNLLGFTLEAFADGHSEIHYTPRPEHMNSFDVTPRRRLHDPARRGHGDRRAQRQPGHGRGHDRDEDQFHAPRQGHAGRSSDGERPADAPHEIDGLHRRHDL
jgi:hypothetical protein